MMVSLWSVSGLLLCSWCVFGNAALGVRYDGYQVWRFKYGDYDKVTTIIPTSQLDVWRRSSATFDLLVTPEIQQILKSTNLNYSVLQKDVQRTIDKQSNTTRLAEPTQGMFDLSVYHPLDEITRFMRAFSGDHSEYVTLVDIGKSYEGRKLQALKIGFPSNKSKDSFWINSEVHAREWISTAVALYLANQIVSEVGVDPVVDELLRVYDWYVMPVLNPDGYVYTWTTDRLWRKTRSMNMGTTCVGVDGNRNYGYKWGGEGASSDPCSNEYMGPFAFSEPEIHALATFLSRTSNNNFRLFLDLHSYSQLWLYPWSYVAENTPEDDYEQQNQMAKLAVQAIVETHGQTYTYGNSGGVMYPASGMSIDWVYGVLGVVHSYTVELRDLGEYGFLLPEYEITPTCEEAYAAIKRVGQTLLNDKPGI